MRSERALKLAIAEMYVQGVSTRRVAEITRELCGLDVSSAQVSRAAAVLDEELEAWRTRELGQCRYLILDARYEKVRHGGSVVSCAVLSAVGVRDDGKRSVLGVSVALSEAEVHWRDFLASLLDRKLRGVELVVSDDHEGLKAALRACFPARALAALPVSPAAQRRGLRPARRDAPRGRRGPARHLQRARPCRGRSSPQDGRRRLPRTARRGSPSGWSTASPRA